MHPPALINNDLGPVQEDCAPNLESTLIDGHTIQDILVCLTKSLATLADKSIDRDVRVDIARVNHDHLNALGLNLRSQCLRETGDRELRS